MTIDTLANLSVAVGRELTNQEWVDLISENFGTSKKVSKDAYHAMLVTLGIKKKHIKTSPYTPYVDCSFGGE